MPKPIEEKEVLLCFAEESSYGVDEEPTVASAIAAMDFELTPEISEVARPVISHTHASQGKAIGSICWKVTFKFRAVGAGDPDTDPLPAPRYESFFKAAGFAVATSGSPVDTHTYDYVTRSEQASLSVYAYAFQVGSDDARLYKLLGMRGSLTYKVAVDEEAHWIFEGYAFFDAPTDVTALDTSSLDLGDATELVDSATGKAMTVTAGGVTMEVSSIEIKQHSAATKVKSVTGTQGYSRFPITAPPDASWQVTWNPIKGLVADYDEWAKILAETTEAVSIVCDSAQGTRTAFTLPAFQIGSVSYEGDDGAVRTATTGYLRDASGDGDDAFSVAISRTP